MILPVLHENVTTQAPASGGDFTVILALIFPVMWLCVILLMIVFHIYRSDPLRP